MTVAAHGVNLIHVIQKFSANAMKEERLKLLKKEDLYATPLGMYKVCVIFYSSWCLHNRFASVFKAEYVHHYIATWQCKTHVRKNYS